MTPADKAGMLPLGHFVGPLECRIKVAAVLFEPFFESIWGDEDGKEWVHLVCDITKGSQNKHMALGYKAGREPDTYSNYLPGIVFCDLLYSHGRMSTTAL